MIIKERTITSDNWPHSPTILALPQRSEMRSPKDSEDNTRGISGRGEVAGGKLVVIAVAFREEGAGGRLSLAIFQLTP